MIIGKWQSLRTIQLGPAEAQEWVTSVTKKNGPDAKSDFQALPWACSRVLDRVLGKPNLAWSSFSNLVSRVNFCSFDSDWQLLAYAYTKLDQKSYKKSFLSCTFEILMKIGNNCAFFKNRWISSGSNHVWIIKQVYW